MCSWPKSLRRTNAIVSALPELNTMSILPEPILLVIDELVPQVPKSHDP